MAKQCTPAQLRFHDFWRRQVIGRFDGGRLTSDGGGVLLRERLLALLVGQSDVKGTARA